MLPDQVFAYYAHPHRGPSRSGRVNVALALRKKAGTVHAWAKAGYVPWACQLELQNLTGGALVAAREHLPVALGGSLALAVGGGPSTGVAA